MHGRFIPEPDRRSRHTIDITVPPSRIWPHVRRLDVTADPIVAVLFRLRGLGRVKSLTEMASLGFRIIGEREPEALALGLIGRPWLPRGGLRTFGEGEFADFDEPGYAKMSWTFELAPTDVGTELSTETRVICTDEVSRRRFLRYWRLVGPFSGLIRSRIVSAIKTRVESINGG